MLKKSIPDSRISAILAGREDRIVCVGYNNIKRIQVGNHIRLESEFSHIDVEVTRIRIYPSFTAMFGSEPVNRFFSDRPSDALKTLQRIYPKEKECLGVYVFELKLQEKK